MIGKKEFLFWLLCVALMSAIFTIIGIKSAAAEEAVPTTIPVSEFKVSGMPKFSIKLGQGGTIVFKDGAHPGGISSKLDIVMSWKLAAWFAIGSGVGVSMPYDAFKPALRFTPTATFLLPAKFGFAIGFLYQYNPEYGVGKNKKPATNVVGPSIGLGYSLVDHVSIGFSIGTGRAVETSQPWTLTLSPAIWYTF